jgi:uncharacterized membrane protein (DUF373 family)
MRNGEGMIKKLELFERYIVMGLAALMVMTIAISTFELAWTLFKDLLTPPRFWLEIEELLDIFGLFLLVLLGIELLETLKAYLVEDIVHVEVVMIVAIIAIARKVIILDLQEYDGMKLIGLATILITLAFGYKILKQSHVKKTLPDNASSNK